MFFFFNTTIIFHITLLNPANKQSNDPTKNNFDENKKLITIMLPAKNKTGRPSNKANDNEKSVGTVSFVTFIK